MSDAGRQRRVLSPTVEASAGSREPSVMTVISAMATSAAPTHLNPRGHHRPAHACLPSTRIVMDKPESIPLRGRPNLLGLGHLHIVGGPGWPARVLTDEQTQSRKHAPLTGRPTATGWRTTS